MVLVTESGMDQHSETASQSIEDTKETVEDAGDAVERRTGTARKKINSGLRGSTGYMMISIYSPCATCKSGQWQQSDVPRLVPGRC
jgi:hypothetical protein